MKIFKKVADSVHAKDVDLDHSCRVVHKDAKHDIEVLNDKK